jgi:sulfite exporter TauE/SafE
MFDFTLPVMLAGLLLGFASSLHCFGMCSGIAASLHLAAASRPGAPHGPVTTALLINSGRVAGYVMAGAAVGAAGASVFGVLDRSLLNFVLRWAAAATLGAVGLSMLGLLPLPAWLTRAGLTVSDALTQLAHALRLPSGAGLLLAGTVWGFCPCAMVYGALVYAMLTGSWSGGALVMLGFGLGTMPTLVASGLGLATLKRRATSVRLQGAVGAALVLLSLASVAVPAATIAAWCHFG